MLIITSATLLVILIMSVMTPTGYMVFQFKIFRIVCIVTYHLTISRSCDTFDFFSFHLFFLTVRRHHPSLSCNNTTRKKKAFILLINDLKQTVHLSQTIFLLFATTCWIMIYLLYWHTRHDKRRTTDTLKCDRSNHLYEKKTFEIKLFMDVKHCSLYHPEWKLTVLTTKNVSFVCLLFSKIY